LLAAACLSEFSLGSSFVPTLICPFVEVGIDVFEIEDDNLFTLQVFNPEEGFLKGLEKFVPACKGLVVGHI
jgi:hypothetical protein